MKFVRLLAVLMIGAGSLLAIPLRPALAATVYIDVGSSYFCDSSYAYSVCPTTINQGDTVEWDFSAFELHTATECGGDNNCDNANPTPLWNSGALQNGQTYSRTFNTVGTFYYQCDIHGYAMRGTIAVMPAGVGGVTELARAGPPGGSSGRLTVWIGLATIAGSAATLLAASWMARRALAASES